LVAQARVVLFVSDMHLGQGTGTEERTIEQTLVRCLKAYESQVTHLYLVGDVFDGYIEYPRLVPKGFVRFMALLADWTDRGIGVTYLAGNHDPWHIDYFATELGVRVEPDHLMEHAEHTLCYIRHGDGLKSTRWNPRALLKNPTLVWLYRTLLPADIGLAFAQKISRSLQGRRYDPRVPNLMRSCAREVLETTAARLVVMGHSHQAELCDWDEGTYMNLGSWRTGSFFGTLDTTHVQLLRWRAGTAELVKETIL